MTITWENGHTTVLATRPFAPNRVKRTGRCTAGWDRFTVKDRVTEDSTGSVRPGGQASATLCILGVLPGTWSLEPGTVFKVS